MMIYAIFLCVSIGCQHTDGLGDHVVYNDGKPVGTSEFFTSKAECERALIRQLGPNQGTLYRCLGKHIDTWQ